MDISDNKMFEKGLKGIQGTLCDINSSLKTLIAVSDKDYTEYLAKKLLNSGENCCGFCAYNPVNNLCENMRNLDHDLDDRMCMAGMREFYTKIKQGALT